jgi:hypothetical protein
VVRDDQPDAREGQAGCCGVAERLVVPMKPGNSGIGTSVQSDRDYLWSDDPPYDADGMRPLNPEPDAPRTAPGPIRPRAKTRVANWLIA